MKKVFAILSTIILTVLLAIPVNADTAAWYQVSFTGADVWAYSADNASQARTDQAAPRRHADYTTGSRVLLDTTYGVDGLVPTTFNTWAPTSGFAFDAINLWGKGGAEAWGETYVSVAGVSSWQVVQAPTGWTFGIVEDNVWYNPGPGAFPVWRSGTGDALSLANMSDPAFLFTFNVLISNPLTAFEPDGKLRLFFGGANDDNQGAGPGNFEVAGSMTLDATAVPLPGTLVLLGSGLAGLGLLRGRKFFKR